MSAPPKGSQLAGLAEIRAALREQRRRLESLAAAERQRLLAERREQSLFATAVGPVVPLKKSATPVLARARPPAIARQRQRDEAAALAESISDAFDVETLLETDDALTLDDRERLGLTPLLEQGGANLRQIGEVAALDRRLHSKPRSANDTACPWPTTR